MSGATTPNAVIGAAVEAAVVFCAVVGFFALMSMFGLFPQETAPLLLAVLGSFGCYLYGRHGRVRFGRGEPAA